MLSHPQLQDSAPPKVPPGPHRAKRLKIDIACQPCRSRKIKCDGRRPACSNCQKKNSLRGSCMYQIRETTYVTEHSPGLGGSPCSPPLPLPPATSPPASSERASGDEVREVYWGGAPGIFAGEVNAAIDERLGLSSSRGGRPSLIPMTDAPLFGFSYRQLSDTSRYQENNVLPPRKHANSLMDIYWQHIHPLEPFLYQEQFRQSYHAVFAGSPLEVDERVFLCSLNIVFALSTQLQEHLDPEKREEASNAYFHRARALLPPELTWEAGSPELVQCLLLMSRYLQCTNNPHQTWMVGGSAVRIAESIGLHIPEVPSSSPGANSQMRRQLWQSCVFIDRGISWVLGRNSTVSLTVAPPSIESLRGDDQEAPHVPYLIKTLELYEIANHIMLAQTPACSNFGDRLGLPRLYQKEDYFSTVLQHDAALNKWEKSIPLSLRLDISQDTTLDVSQRQRFILHLRLLHTRILLFRPILARFCLPQFQIAVSTTLDQGLSDRLLRDCASLGIESAQKMIALVHEQHKLNGSIGILPWWYRIFYIYIAGTALIATMLRADLFTPVVSQSWNTVLAALRAHQHLSPFVQQLVTTFQTLSDKISESHHPGGGQLPSSDGLSTTYFQDIFQDMGFDPENFIFGKEDMSWLNSLESTR